jgi:hypothetical protein
LDLIRQERAQNKAFHLKVESMAKSVSKKLVVCINNDGYAASLERRKIYVMLRDPGAEKHGLVRIIDESGDDYLYPNIFFRPIALPQSIKKAVLAAA